MLHTVSCLFNLKKVAYVPDYVLACCLATDPSQEIVTELPVKKKQVVIMELV